MLSRLTPHSYVCERLAVAIMNKWNANKNQQHYDGNRYSIKPKSSQKRQYQTRIDQYFGQFSNDGNNEQKYRHHIHEMKLNETDRENEHKIECKKNTQNLKELNGYTIVSGGQIGADQGGLEAAKEIGVRTAGWAPYDFYTMNGSDVSLKHKYGLKAVERTASTFKNSKGYLKRDRLNVDMSDIVIAFIYDKPKSGKGTLTTINYAKTGNCRYQNINRKIKIHECIDTNNKYWKPTLVIVDLSESNINPNAIVIKNFIQKTNCRTIMIAGSAMDSLQPLVKNVIIKAFKLLLSDKT